MPLGAVDVGFLNNVATWWPQSAFATAPIAAGLRFQLKQVTRQLQLGQDWVLSQRVVDNILQQSIVSATAVALSY